MELKMLANVFFGKKDQNRPCLITNLKKADVNTLLFISDIPNHAEEHLFC